MDKFAQHTVVNAQPGKRDALLAKFMETLEFLQSNPACELTLVSAVADDPNAVALTEVWTSKADHTAATQSDVVAAWANDMPDLVEGPPVTQVLSPAGWIAERVPK